MALTIVFNHVHNTRSGVAGQSIPLSAIYPGLKRPMLDYTRVY